MEYIHAPGSKERSQISTCSILGITLAFTERFFFGTSAEKKVLSTTSRLGFCSKGENDLENKNFGEQCLSSTLCI